MATVWPRSVDEQWANRSSERRLVMHSGITSCSTRELADLVCCCCRRRRRCDLENIQEKRFLPGSQTTVQIALYKPNTPERFSVSVAAPVSPTLILYLWKTRGGHLLMSIYFLFLNVAGKSSLCDNQGFSTLTPVWLSLWLFNNGAESCGITRDPYDV